MAKPGKVWQILAMNRSQNVVFYGPINYSRPGVGAFRFAVGAFFVGALLHPCIHAPIFVGAFAPTIGRFSSNIIVYRPLNVLNQALSSNTFFFGTEGSLSATPTGNIHTTS